MMNAIRSNQARKRHPRQCQAGKCQESQSCLVGGHCQDPGQQQMDCPQFSGKVKYFLRESLRKWNASALLARTDACSCRRAGFNWEPL